MNVVVNMHVKDVDDGDDDSKMLVKKARLKGDFKDSVFQDFDLIGLMEASYVQGTGDKKGERVQVRNIRWHSEPRFPALRDRFNKLPRFTPIDFTEDDYWRIFNAITEGMDSIPETQVLDEVETAADSATAPAEADVKGGPVEEPKLPRKQTAKKTPAKKATKTAAKKAAPPPEPEVERTDAEVIEMVADKLDATPVAEEPTPEPEKPAAKAAKSCGDQPASMSRFDAAPGCGRVLSADNAGRAQIAVIKAKTYLCDDCFDKYLANAQ